jgi:nitrate reductase delta subunit
MTARAVAAMAASLLLRYPDEPALAALPTVRAALAGLPRKLAEPLGIVADHRSGDPTALAAEYVDVFDLRRRTCLYLTYYTAGDTRARGRALVAFAAAHRAAGFAVEGGELPDHLPTVLELAARAGGEPGWGLLREHRVGLDLLAAALADLGSPYRHAVEAVRSMLPPSGPAEAVAAAVLARSGPPSEQVGLQPFTLGGRR